MRRKATADTWTPVQKLRWRRNRNSVRLRPNFWSANDLDSGRVRDIEGVNGHRYNGVVSPSLVSLISIARELT
jgi:hypothetical protein